MVRFKMQIADGSYVQYAVNELHGRFAAQLLRAVQRRWLRMLLKAWHMAPSRPHMPKTNNNEFFSVGVQSQIFANTVCCTVNSQELNEEGSVLYVIIVETHLSGTTGGTNARYCNEKRAQM